MKEAGCCSKWASSIRKEFRLEKFGLTHLPADDFYKSQWQRGSRSIWWLLYRWCAAGFFIGAVLSSAIEYFNGGTFFIYLTDWGLILCMITTTYGAVLATIWHFSFSKRVDPVNQGASLKVYWALHWATLVMAVLITLMFWSFLFPENPSMGSDPYNLMQHAFNSIIMLIDHMVVAFPSRILHFVYPLAIGLLYLIFSVIYYFSGGTDWNGNTAIYPILDWENSPGTAAATAVGAMALCFVLSFLLFELYKLRKFFYRECANSQKAHVLPK